MNEFPSTKEAAQAILEIIRTSKNRVVLISPFVDPTESFYKELENTSASSIILVCIESKLKQDVKRRLKSISKLQILNHENVHAKCYYNEELLLQTSLNLSQYSENHNIEIGTLIKRSENQDRFHKASAIPEMIVQDAISKINRYANPAKPKVNGETNTFNYEKLKLTLFEEIPGQNGTCIRCRKGLSYLNGNFALCSSCYNKWSASFELNAQENWCHWCGEKHPTSKRKPLCISCYRKYQVLTNQKNIALSKPDSVVPEKELTERAEPINEIQTPVQTQEAVPAKSNKKYWVVLGILVGVCLGAWAFLSYFNTAFTTTKDRNTVLKEIIHNYYAALNKNPIKVGNYFAADIESYIKMKNLSSSNIDSLITAGTKEFMYGENKILDSTIYISKDHRGNTVVGFWMNFTCFRKSKTQYQKCKVHEELVFDNNNKIIAVNELKIDSLKYSFKKPE